MIKKSLLNLKLIDVNNPNFYYTLELDVSVIILLLNKEFEELSIIDRWRLIWEVQKYFKFSERIQRSY